MKLSVCLLVLNEEKNIRKCLESAKKVADEIIVIIDENSGDKTEEIAKKITDEVYRAKHEDNFHINKQSAIDQAKGDWVLWLDGDEFLSDELIEEIRLVLKNEDKFDGYLIPRKNIIFDKWISHTGWYPDYQLRLFKNGKGKYPCEKIHENPKVKGKVGKLKNALLHNNYTSVSQFIDKLNRYTSLDAKNLAKEMKEGDQTFGRLRLRDFIVRPIDEFVKRFFAWEGWKDGWHGLILSIMQSFYEFVVVVKVWEMGNFSEKNVNWEKLDGEIKEVGKKYRWWRMEKKIKESKGIAKIWWKVRRKF